MAETLAAIELIAQLPSATEVTLEDEAQIVAARNAYDQLPTVEQQSLVANYEHLTSAEATLRYLKGTGDGGDREKPTDGKNEISFVSKYFYIGFIIAGVAIVCFIAYVLFTKFYMGGKKSAEDETAPAEDEGKSE